MQSAAVRGSIKTVQVRGPNTGWISLTNVWGASWEVSSVPQPPLDFRIQDDSGTDVSVIPFLSFISIATFTCCVNFAINKFAQTEKLALSENFMIVMSTTAMF